MSAPAPTPARPRRRRRWLPWLLALPVVLLAVLLGLWLFLLHTDTGRDLVLERAAPLAGLRYAEAEGSLDGPLTLRGATFDAGDVTIEADVLQLDLAPRALWSRRVRVESLRGEGLRVLLPAESPARPEPAGDPLLALPELRLPVAIAIEDARLRDLVVQRRGADEPLLSIRQLALEAQVDRDGAVRLERLALDSEYGQLTASGTLRLDGGRSMDLALALRGPSADAPEARLQLQGRGEVLAATLRLPDGDQLALHLDGTRWRLDSALTAVDPSPWWPGWTRGPLTLLVQARGQGGRAVLDPGTLVLDGQRVDIGRSEIALDREAQQLAMQPLVLTPWRDGAAAGTATLTGSLGLDGGAHRLEAALSGVVLPGEAGGTLEGSAVLEGTADAYTLRFDGMLLHPDARLPVELAGQGDRSALTIERLRLSGDQGEALSAHGRVQWSPTPAVQLDATLRGFDPARLHGDFPGALSGAFALEARQEGDAWHADLVLESLSGTLRGQRVQGRGRLSWGEGGGRTDLRLQLGGSEVAVTGRAGEVLDLTVTLAPLRLADVLADAGGRLEGTVRLRGTAAAPELALDLSGSSLSLAGQQAGTLTLEGHLATGGTGPADLELVAGSLELGGLAFAEARLSLAGTRARHRLQAQLAGDTALALDAQGALGEDGGWRGTLDALVLDLPEQPPWRLRAPAALAVLERGFSLAPACLAGPEIAVCAEAEGTAATQSAELTLESLPLAALAPVLSAGQPIPLVLAGEVSGEARLRREGEDLALQARLLLPQGSAAFQTAETRELLSWQDVTLEARTEGTQLRVQAQGALEGSGRLDLALQGEQPWRDPGAAVQGEIALALPRLRVLELLTPHVADPDGRLQAELDVSGSWQEPRLDGAILVQDLRTELPALGITLRESQLRAEPSADGSLDLSGTLDTGEGALRVSGRMATTAEGLEATVQLRGERVLASDTPLARALVSPDLQLDYQAGEGLEISGRVAVPEARLDLDRLEGSVSPSPDVVVVDPVDPEEDGGALPVRADVELVLGEDVVLEGMGFDGRIRGTLRVRERPGRVTTGRGALEVTGEYTAYGQDLEVVHGRLLYSGTPLDNPSLDVRAVREIREQTVGLNIRGSARAPELEIFAEPPLEQAEAVSYLVLGRPLGAATSADSGQLSQAAAAVGGNFLAAKLGARLGFDTFEVGDSDALGTTAFTVGKYLSPKLYVSYGTALFEEGSILTLRYILSRRFELELESGAENRVGVNYTLER